MSNCTWCNGPNGGKWNVEKDGKKFKSKELFCSLKCKSEYDNEYGVTWEKSGCFVATAVYGDYDHPIVQDLRVFRNQSLYTNSMGRKFVNFYYKNSPKYADRIQASPVLKTLVRVLFIIPLHFTLKHTGFVKKKVQ
jgi:hypothetical protein